jgi:hypothetical protein
MVCFYALYKQKKNVAPNMVIPRGNLLEIVFALGLWYSFCAKNTLPSCTKTNLHRSQTNGVLTVVCRIWCVFMHFIYRKNKSHEQKMTMPCGNLLEIFFGLELWYSFCAKNTLQSCTKTNLQRNQTNGV